MIISIDTEKAFDKIPQCFMIKFLKIFGRLYVSYFVDVFVEYILLNVFQQNKGYAWQAYILHHIEWQKVESRSSKIRDKIKIFSFNTFLNTVQETLEH